MKIALLIPIILILAVMARVRLAPVDVDRWHVDPFTAPDPGMGGVADQSGQQSGFFAGSADHVAQDLAQIATATPRTKLIAQDGNRYTFQTRSRGWGFPDYTTFETRQTDDGVALAITARLRFGRKDFGVNAKRVALWLDQLTAADHMLAGQ
ncbi:DUF1499 domain-containing protein [Aestuariibius sp. HNIBRBA575]|uniref:DUF1499 domain-containing protein n=1 Tax=Aestuariibius sp. HNIBRBA575 TaxID=3233343 RepID=UPI0034A4C616